MNEGPFLLIIAGAGRARHGAAYGFLLLWLQIAIESSTLFHCRFVIIRDLLSILTNIQNICFFKVLNTIFLNNL